MATPASLRLPLRTVCRSVKGNLQSSSPARPQNVIIPSIQNTSRRHASDVAPSQPTSVDESAPLSLLKPSFKESQEHDNALRYPRAVQALYLRPLKRTPTHGLPVCDLQLRSYNVRNLEFFCDFAMRAAYYLNLPASGPIPLPRIVERWTVPKGHIIHKKAQENFERKTLRRLIQIKDGHLENVELWLAFLRKHAYYGVGMKANVFEFAKLDLGKEMDKQLEDMKEQLDDTWKNVAFKKDSEAHKKALDFITRENDRARRISSPFPRTFPSSGAGEKVFK